MRKPTFPVSILGDTRDCQPHGRRTITTQEYFGRYIRAAATSTRSVVHYAIRDVGRQSPTQRLRCRPGVFHRRVAPPGCTLIGGRPPADVWLTLLQEVRGPRFVVSCGFSGRGWAGSFPAATPGPFFCICLTLLRLVLLPGPLGGFQAATTEDEEVSRSEEFSFLNSGERLDQEFHRVALMFLLFFACQDGAVRRA